ncbi:Proteasome subunit alpha type-3 [Hordeum vulgare]|nr:Proteasome subunit alpha type-3 [Hordeum vulgare]
MTGEGRLEAPCRHAADDFSLHDEAQYGSIQLQDKGTVTPVKIASTMVMADDGGVCDVVPFSRHCCWRPWYPARDAPGETLDLGLPDRTMMAPSMSLFLLGHRFGACVDWKGHKEDQCYIYRKAKGGSRRHDTAEVRRPARVDGYVQDGGVV